MFMSVLLPEPLAPMSVTSSPLAILRDTPLEHGQVHLAEVVSLVNVRVLR